MCVPFTVYYVQGILDYLYNSGLTETVCVRVDLAQGGV